MPRVAYHAQIVESESTIQQKLVALLHSFARPDICWWACPNGDWRTPRSGARLKRQGVRPGASDLMFVINRIFHGLELKSKSGYQSQYQKDFEANLARAGGVYHLARGLNEALDVLVDIEAFRPEFNQQPRGQQWHSASKISVPSKPPNRRGF